MRIKRRGTVSAAVVAVLLSCITVAGYAFNRYNSAAPLFRTTDATTNSILALLALAIIYFLICKLFFWLLDYVSLHGANIRARIRARHAARGAASGKTGDYTTHDTTARGVARGAARTNEHPRLQRIWHAFCKHPILYVALLIFICYLPYLIYFYPGNVPYDGYMQLDEFMGVRTLNDTQPVIATWIMGGIFYIGRSVLNDNFGIFLFVFLQTVAFSFVLSRVIWIIARLKHKILAGITLALFIVVPIWPNIADAFIKDALFLLLFILFCTMLVEICVLGKRITVSYALALTFTALMCCLVRSNGIAIVLPSLIGTAIVSKENTRYISILIMAAVGLFVVVWTFLMLPALHIPGTSASEGLSIPYQQTARYVKDYPDEVTSEERANIDTVLDTGKLPDKYDPGLSDQVRWSKTGNDTSPTPEYFESWFQMGLKHPLTYLSATINNTYGYFYPFANFNITDYWQMYIKGEPLATNTTDIHYALLTPSGDPGESQMATTSTFGKYAQAWRDAPVVCMLTRPGFYMWILIMLAAYAISKKRYRLLALLVPAACAVFSCVISPVNGLLRYALPYMAEVPLLIACVMTNSGVKRWSNY
jgi:hypothetical protein